MLDDDTPGQVVFDVCDEHMDSYVNKLSFIGDFIDHSDNACEFENLLDKINNLHENSDQYTNPLQTVPKNLDFEKNWVSFGGLPTA